MTMHTYTNTYKHTQIFWQVTYSSTPGFFPFSKINYTRDSIFFFSFFTLSFATANFMGKIYISNVDICKTCFLIVVFESVWWLLDQTYSWSIAKPICCPKILCKFYIALDTLLWRFLRALAESCPQWDNALNCALSNILLFCYFAPWKL